MKRRDFLKASVGAAALAGNGQLFSSRQASAQSNRDTLLSISEAGWNGLDPHVLGASFPSYGVAWNCYDRLLGFAAKSDPSGLEVTDGSKVVPELAEDFNQQGLSTTFKLRKDAVFQDGTPITAKDVKYSLDRCLGVGGNARFQLRTGSMENPEQFVVIDDHTFRIDLPNTNPLMLPNLAVPMGNIMNSELIKKNSTTADPWGLEWTKRNLAGSGAYRLTNFTTDTMGLARFPEWKMGKVEIERVIWRIVPSAATRRALLERGDADICNEFPPKDIADMRRAGKLSVYATPLANCAQFVAMNTKIPPFDNPKVRQAIAYATPYESISSAALFGTARTLDNGPAEVKTSQWPQPSPFKYDLTKAKQLLNEAGLPDGFETTLSFDLGNAGTLEPMCILLQESLAKIGIKATLNRVPGSNWRASFIERKLPFITNAFNSFLDYPNYYYDFVFGKASIFNSANYESAKMEELLTAARRETDKSKYETLVKSFIQLSFEDIPNFPVYQPYQYVAMQKRIDGYRASFHRQIDFRTLRKA